ncbi:hypothetical protein AB0E08_43440, partial [Streptomyces sp. NPDC048281]
MEPAHADVPRPDRPAPPHVTPQGHPTATPAGPSAVHRHPTAPDGHPDGRHSRAPGRPSARRHSRASR